MTRCFDPRFTITNRITEGLTRIERARGFLETATLSEDWIREMGKRAAVLGDDARQHRVAGRAPRPTTSRPAVGSGARATSCGRASRTHCAPRAVPHGGGLMYRLGPIARVDTRNG